MWQRIQTLYMLVALVLIGVAMAYTAKTEYLILFGVAVACNLVPLLSFKHRMLQFRILVFGAVVLLGLQVWMAVEYFTSPDTVKFNYSVVVPFIAAVLDVLALRGVMQDELLVRSSSRLRAARRKEKLNSKK